MTSRPFDYYAPTTLDEALALMSRYGDGARALAGGQSLVQQMNRRLYTPAVVVDLNRVPELAYVRTTGPDGADEGLWIGAMTRMQTLLAASSPAREVNAALVQTIDRVAFPAVRSRGTVGGSVAYAEPGAQVPLLLTMLDATATVAREGVQRTTPVADLFSAAYTNSLAPDELLVEIAVPPLAREAQCAIQEFRLGHSGPPLVTVIAIVETDAAGTITSARLGVSGATDVPTRLREEERQLIGQRAGDDDVFTQVAESARGRVQRGDLVLADVALRRRATRGLVRRALHASTGRAGAPAGKEQGA